MVGSTPPADGTPARSSSNLLTRVLVSVLFIPCFILITLRGDLHYLFLMDLVIFTGLVEFYALMSGRGFRPARVVGIGCGLALSWYAYFRTGVYGNFFLALALLLLMTVELTRRSVEEAVTRIATTIFGVLYVGWLGSHFILLRELPRVVGLDYGLGADFVFVTVLLTWGCDTGAYVVGRSLGKHPLYPRVSPKKSREGALGGVLFALLAGLLAQKTFASEWLEPSTAVILALVAAIAGQTGDLVESLIKRGCQVKDSASIIPGHGGTLDRFDSLFFSAPLLYYALKFFVL